MTYQKTVKRCDNMFCTRCGTPCSSEEIYCHKCGTKLPVNPPYPEKRTPIYPVTPSVMQTPSPEQPQPPVQMVSPEMREEKKTRNLTFALVGILSACIVLVVVAVVIVISLISERSNTTLEESIDTGNSASSPSDVSNSTPSDVSVTSEVSGESSAESSEDFNAAEVPVEVSDDISVSESVDEPVVTVSAASSEQESSDSREDRYLRLKIPGNTWSFIRGFSNLKLYTVVDIDRDDEFELITVSNDGTVTLYNYNWNTNEYERSGSMKADVPNTSQGDQVVFGMVDDQFCVRFYDFSSSSDSTASVKDTLCDVRTMRVNSSKQVGSTKRDRIWYDHLEKSNKNLDEIIDEIIMFDASYNYTNDLVLPDLQSRVLTEDFLETLMAAYDCDTKQERLDFLDEIENETAGLKGYIFERGGANYVKFTNQSWYNNYYQNPYEKTLSGTETAEEENKKRNNYNYHHYWNGDEERLSPLSGTYDNINRGVIESLRKKIKDS